MLAILLVGFLVFAAAARFFGDPNIKKISTFGAIVCAVVFLVLVLLQAFPTITVG